MRDQWVEKMNNWSVESWIIEVNPKLHAVMESYRAVETILEQLRPFLIHAKRKEDLRMLQKIISDPHNFDSSLTLDDIILNHLLLHWIPCVKHCTVNIWVLCWWMTLCNPPSRWPFWGVAFCKLQIWATVWPLYANNLFFYIFWFTYMLISSNCWMLAKSTHLCTISDIFVLLWHGMINSIHVIWLCYM